MACHLFAPSHYLRQCWVIVNCILRTKVQWNFNQNTKLFSHENASENIVCKMATILSRGRWVSMVAYSDTRPSADTALTTKWTTSFRSFSSIKWFWIISADQKAFLKWLPKTHNILWHSECSYCHVNSLWPSDTIWWHRSGSILAQVMACCLTAPSHYLKQSWFTVKGILWHSPNSMISIHKMILKNTFVKLRPYLWEANEFISIG